MLTHKQGTQVARLYNMSFYPPVEALGAALFDEYRETEGWILHKFYLGETVADWLRMKELRCQLLFGVPEDIRIDNGTTYDLMEAE